MASSKAVNDPPPNASEDKSEETWSWEWVSEGGQKEKTKASLQASKEKWEKIKSNNDHEHLQKDSRHGVKGKKHPNASARHMDNETRGQMKRINALSLETRGDANTKQETVLSYPRQVRTVNEALEGYKPGDPPTVTLMEWDDGEPLLEIDIDMTAVINKIFNKTKCETKGSSSSAVPVRDVD